MKDSLVPICLFLGFASIPFAIRLKYILFGRKEPINTITTTCFLDVFFIVGLVHFLGPKFGLVKGCFAFYLLSAATHYLLFSGVPEKSKVITFVVPVVIPAGMYFAGLVGYFFLSFLKMG